MSPLSLLSALDDAAQVHDDLRRESDLAQQGLDDFTRTIRTQAERETSGIRQESAMGAIPNDVIDFLISVAGDAEVGNLVVVYLRRSHSGNNAGSIMAISKTLAEHLVRLDWIRPATQTEWDAQQSPASHREPPDTTRGLRTARAIHATEFLPRQAA